MNMIRARIRTDALQGGDIVHRAHSGKAGSLEGREIRTVVIGTARADQIHYHGQTHPVTRVKALDLENNQPVTWLAVPDQHVTVIR